MNLESTEQKQFEEPLMCEEKGTAILAIPVLAGEYSPCQITCIPYEIIIKTPIEILLGPPLSPTDGQLA